MKSVTKFLFTLLLCMATASFVFGQADQQPVQKRDGTDYILKGKAPAYTPVEGKDILLSEGFEGSWPPSGWSLIPSSGGWARSNSGYGHTGNYGAWHTWIGCPFDSWIRTPSMNFTVATAFELSFWQMGNDTYYHTFYEVSVSTNGGSSWTQVWAGTAPEDYYQQIVLDLSAFAGNPSVIVGFHFSIAHCFHGRFRYDSSSTT